MDKITPSWWDFKKVEVEGWTFKNSLPHKLLKECKKQHEKEMQNYVKIEDIEKLIERYEHDYRYTQAALLKDLKALVENKEKTA